MKWNISQAHVLALPNLQKSFEVEMDVSGYVMGEVLMQGGKMVCWNLGFLGKPHLVGLRELTFLGFDH